MITLQEHLDALDGMVEQGTSVPKMRNQIAFIGREDATLEADNARLAQDKATVEAEHLKLKKTHTKAVTENKALISENAKLIKANAALVAENLALTAELKDQRAKLEDKRLQESVDEPKRQILECLFGEAMAAEEIADAIRSPQGRVDYHTECLNKAGFIEHYRFRGDQRRIDGPDWGWAITQMGREWIMRQSS